MVVSLPYFKDATGGANAYSGRQLAKLVLGVGGYVLSVPFLIRVARYVILDEEPSCSYVRQFFQKTTWIYILKDVLVGIEYLVGLVLVGVFPCVLVWLIVGAGYVHSPRAVTSLVLLCAGGVLFGAVFFLAAQITLVRPAIAIGKVTSLLKIDTLGRPARMSLFLVNVINLSFVVAFVVPPIVLLYVPVDYNELWEMIPMVSSLCMIGLWMVFCVAQALIYKRLSPYWDLDEPFSHIPGFGVPDGPFRPEAQSSATDTERM